MNGRRVARIGAMLRPRLAVAVSAVMVGTLLQAISTTPSLADDNHKGRPALPAADKPVAGGPAGKAKPRTLQKGVKVPTRAPRASWPKGGSHLIRLPAESAKNAGNSVKVADLPLSLASSASFEHTRNDNTAATGTQQSVEVRVVDHKSAVRAGTEGVLFTLTAKYGRSDSARTNARVAVTVDYSAFAEAFGGGYASRMQLLQLPACALTTPHKAACRTGKPVEASNNTEQQTLTADTITLTSAPTVLAATAAEDGDKGDYKATSLSPSATWSTNLNAGDFSWSYDMPVPDVPGGLEPSVGLAYTSSAIDGRTGGTNNQASWVGDGFDIWPGSIERRYKQCADDGVESSDGNKPGDLCWAYDNAFLTFNGKGGELVSAGNNEWKLKRDDGTKIKHLTSSTRDNGDDDNEYWRVTTPDGTRYYFGYHKLNGWKEKKDTTESTWTVPVYGDDANEPCHKSTFADSWCQQAWRWNLDYAVDVHGNAIAYYYKKETNSYGRNLKAVDDTPYDRGGYLDRIEYGLTSADLYANQALAKVTFTNAERCIPQSGVTCEPGTIDDKAENWHDTPWDLNCKSDTDCDQGRLSPTFWTRKRLTQVTTEVLKAGTFTKVDSWQLAHHWGTADIDYQLLLESIQHTGHTATTPITLPKTTFVYKKSANRLDKTGDGKAPFIKQRLSTVADEYGGQIDIEYSSEACSWGNLPTPQTNITRCFPQYMGGSTSDDPDKEWFNKYVVKSVTATDRTGGAPDQVTRYTYLDGAAWHFDDDDGLSKEKFKTWSQWRGYGHVRVQTGGQGGADAMNSQEDTYFLRGMDGDKKDTSTDAGTKSVVVSLEEGEGDPITDHPSAAGFNYKSEIFSGPDGKVLEKEISRPWHHETAKRVRAWGTVTANLTGTSHTKKFTSLDNGDGKRWRTTSTATDFDTTAGRPTQTDDYGDTTTALDNKCIRSTYADNTEENILDLPSRVETVATACADSPDRSKDVISDVRTAYDGGAYGDAPTNGDATATATLKKHDGTKATYLESGATYDTYGRQLSTTDLTATVTVNGTSAPVRTPRTDGRTTKTAFSPTTGLPTKTTVTTPPATKNDATTAQTTTTELDPLRGQPTAEVDTNGKRTEFAHDALGRSTKVWLANRRTSQLPSYEFTYFITDNQPAAIRTQTLTTGGGAQIASYTLYDGFQRERQIQKPGPNGGRILTDTFYDERGLITKTFAPYYTEGKPQTTLFKPDNALTVETQSRHTYDGLGRETETRKVAGNGDGGAVLSTTRTLYGGDRTTVIPPEGGTVTTTITDARGQTTQLLQHHARTAEAAADRTLYEHTPAGLLKKVTDPAGNTWTYEYDQLGRLTTTEDPDKGNTTRTYDDHGQLTTTTDARGTTLTTLYDDLGRRTELRQGNTEGRLRAKWVYDTVSGAKGQLAESTRYVNGAAYTSKITMYDRLYQPMKAATIIPEAEPGLAGTYESGTDYYDNGLIAATNYSAAGSLPGGGLSYTYEDDTLRPVKVYDGRGLTSVTTYSNTGKPLQYELSGLSGGKKTWVTNSYESGTQRLATSKVERQDIPGVDQYTTYGYDQSDNITSVSDVSRSGTDAQCFTYDYLRRLTEAWTQSAKTCENKPSAEAIGGPAPYWHSYTYDQVGNRRTETQHDIAGDSAKNTLRIYNYPEPGKPHPHALESLETKRPSGESKDSYTYDKTGNTETRTLSGDTQTLKWDAEGHLAEVTEPSGDSTSAATSYIYDADGNRLISRTATETTLYLGNTEITLIKGSQKPKATRYLDLGGGHQAVRTDDDNITLTLADHHGTAQLAIEAKTLKLSQRRTTPFGGQRGEQPTAWPGTKGFIGGTTDTTTNLTHLGAREYDPALGRFISVDPVMDLTDPQQANGYAYANNNPVSFSDPSGLRPDGPAGGAGYNDDAANRPAGRAGSGWVLDSYGGWSYRHERFWPNPGGSEKSARTLDYTWSWRAQAKGVDPTRGPLFKIIGEDHKPGFFERAFTTIGVGIAEGLNIGPALDCGMAGDAGRCTDFALGMIPGMKFARWFKGSGPKNECHSFTSGTEVLLADGSGKAIEDVKVGEKLTVSDPDTGKTTTREVVATILTEDDKDFVDLTVAHDGTPGSLIATTTHPFWVQNENRWANAGDLAPGMVLRTPDGKITEITKVRRFQRHARTYDLTIKDIHTYYVLAGTTPVLVHNCNGQIDYNSSDLSRAAYKARVKAGVGPGRNVAAARVEGLNEPVIGFSKGGGHHSENHILDQLTERGISPSRITELYSERQPCSTCGSLLDNALSPGTPAGWSVPWGENTIINQASNELLRQMIAAAGG